MEKDGMDGIEAELVQRVGKYRKLTGKALKKARICVAKGSALHEIAVDFREMAQNYYNDAQHFEKQGKLLLALAAYSYAHAWLDSGARMGIFDVKQDSKLFTLYR